MKNKILEVKNLRKTYHDSNGEIEAIKNINFDIYEEEFVSIVGPSGCGKSTLLSLLANIEKQSSGEINWSKENIVIGYMLQTDSLFPWRNILDNALVGLEIRNQLTDDNKQYVIGLLKTYGLGDFMYKYPDSLSGGMRQRVALIRTLAIKPDILLLDEAFSALDSQSRLKVSEDVYKIIKKEHKTAIMVTHDINEPISLINMTPYLYPYAIRNLSKKKKVFIFLIFIKLNIYYFRYTIFFIPIFIHYHYFFYKLS